MSLVPSIHALRCTGFQSYIDFTRFRVILMSHLWLNAMQKTGTDLQTRIRLPSRPTCHPHLPTRKRTCQHSCSSFSAFLTSSTILSLLPRSFYCNTLNPHDRPTHRPNFPSPHTPIPSGKSRSKQHNRFVTRPFIRQLKCCSSSKAS